LALAAHTCNAPTLTFAQTEYQRMNETFYTAGKPKWNEINMTFFDSVLTASSNALSNSIPKIRDISKDDISDTILMFS
jgi:hypothetical protein